MSDQDWTTVTFSKTNKQKATAGVSGNAHQVAQAKASGLVSTERRFGAAENKGSHAPTGNMKKLEESTDEFKHGTVNRNVAKAITQARLAKKMTQAQLATAINERPQVIQQYESGAAIPNPQVMSKLDRTLGTHLPRK